MADTIIRTQTAAEKLDYEDISNVKKIKKDFKWQYRKSLIEEEQKHVEKREPFCFRCARRDFLEKEDSIRIQAKLKDIPLNEPKLIPKEFKSFGKYAHKDRFKFLRKKEARDKIIVGTSKVDQIVGHYDLWVCKERGCQISVFHPLEEEKKGDKDGQV